MVKSKKTMLVLAILIIVLVFTMGACGGGGGNAGGSGGSAAANGGGSAPAGGGSGTAGADKALNVLCFQGYTEPGWVTPFEQATGIKVNATYAGTVDEMFTKAAAGGEQYDVVSTDCGSVQRYYDAGLLDPIDQGKIPNYEKLSKFFKDQTYKVIDGKLYHIPMCWGSNNVVYNKDAVGVLPDSWSVLWDPKFKGQVSVTDESNNNVITAAISLGITDPFNLTDDQYAKVKDRLTEIAKNCRTFSNGFDNEFQLLSTGETNASISGYDSGLIMKLRDEAKMSVGRVTPTEGIYIWIDGWVMLKNAAHPDAAHAWMDFMLSDEAQPALAKMMNFGAVTPSAKDALDPDVVKMTSYDNIDNIKVPIFVVKNPESFDKRNELWNEVKASL